MRGDLGSDLTALRRLWPAIRAYRGRFVQTVLASLSVQIGTVGAAVASAWLAGLALVTLDPGWPTGRDAVLGGLALLLVAAAAAGTWAEMYVAHDLAYLVLAAFRVRLFDRLRRTQPSRSDPRRSGDLSATAMSDVESLEWIYAHVFAQVGTAAVTVLGGTIALALIDPVVLAVLVPATALLLSVPWWFAKRATAHGAELRQASASYTSDIIDTVQGLSEIAEAGAMPRRRAQLDASWQRVERAGVRNALRGSVEAASGDLLVSLAAIGALFIVSLHVHAGQIPVSSAPIVVALIGAVLAPTATVASTLKELGGLRAAASRLFALLDAPDATEPAAHPLATKPTGEVLRVSSLWFGYDPDRPVLRGVDFALHRGEVVAVVGASGAGKSTLINLIRRFWDADQGSIRVLGTDIRDLADADLRRHTAIVEQDVRVFAGSLRDNLTLGRPDATPEVIATAVADARLGTLVAGLPAGLDSPVGERGTGLSGGEAARLALARALVMEPDLLVLDEATANLDASIELELHRALSRTAPSRATLIVAHRRSTVERADRVIVLEGGRVSADTTPDGLSATGVWWDALPPSPDHKPRDEDWASPDPENTCAAGRTRFRRREALAARHRGEGGVSRRTTGSGDGSACQECPAPGHRPATGGSA